MKIDYILKLATAFEQHIIKLAGIECYHVSESDLEVGKTYSFDSSLLGNVNPLNESAQTILEEVRRKEFPDKPSRLTSFFCSPFKRSLWLKPDKANQTLYKVEALEPYHIGDIGIIDRMIDRSGRLEPGSTKAAQQYWRSETAFSTNYGIEIITPRIKILEKYDSDPIVGTKTYILKKDLIPNNEWQRPLLANPDDPIIITMTGSYHLERVYDKKGKIKKPEFPAVAISLTAKTKSKRPRIIPEGYNEILKRDIFQKIFEYVEPIE